MSATAQRSKKRTRGSSAAQRNGDALVPANAWHLSPQLDMFAYHWSWLPPLAVLLLLGDTFPIDYHFMLLLAWALNFSHQAVSLPLVYLDRELFKQERRRLTVVPLGLLALFVPTLLSWRHTLPAHSLGVPALMLLPAVVLLLAQLDVLLRAGHALPSRTLWAIFTACVALPLVSMAYVGDFAPRWLLCGLAVCSVALASVARSGPEHGAKEGWLRAGGFAVVQVAVATLCLVVPFPTSWPEAPLKARELLSPVYVVAYGWNFWHIYMQKYGILRLHSAKCGGPAERRTPAWVDRLFVFAWLPLLVAVVVPPQLHAVLGRYSELRPIVVPLLTPLQAVRAPLVALGLALVLAAVLAFVVYERRANGTRNVARLSAGVAFFLLSASFFVLNPIKVALAFGISHTIEYFVFVWGWQRRKFAQRKPGLMGRLMQRPALSVFGFMVAAALFWYAGDAWGRDFGAPPRLLGLTPAQWLIAFAPYLAMSHFYFDGFLWKMRKPTVREHL